MNSPEKMKAAHEQWALDQTGPLSVHFNSICIAFPKHPPLYDSEEFNSLDKFTQDYIRDPAVPAFELAFNGPLVPPTYVFQDTSDSFLSTAAILINPQSRGQITLQSSNPLEPPLIDLAYLTHPFDRLSLITATREAMRFVQTPIMARYRKDTILAPKSENDEDIWNFIKDNVSPIWHANGTVMMGMQGDAGACVDSDLHVFGLQNLRVADLSVCPFTPDAHTQATAYLIGQAAAEKIISEHQLE